MVPGTPLRAPFTRAGTASSFSASVIDISIQASRTENSPSKNNSSRTAESIDEVVAKEQLVGYDTEYPGWFLNRDEFLGAAKESGLTLLREFLINEVPYVPNAPEAADYRGFLFAPTSR